MTDDETLPGMPPAPVRLTDGERAAIAVALYEYPLGSPELDDAVRRLAPTIEAIIARRLIAAQETP